MKEEHSLEWATRAFPAEPALMLWTVRWIRTIHQRGERTVFGRRTWRTVLARSGRPAGTAWIDTMILHPDMQPISVGGAREVVGWYVRSGDWVPKGMLARSMEKSEYKDENED